MVVDTGPVVAMANRRDNHHESYARLLDTFPGPLFIPEPLLTEIGYMLATRAGAQVEADFLRDVADGTYQLVSVNRNDLRRAANLVESYASLPLGTADACVVAVAERLNLKNIATLNRRDFMVVRPSHTPEFNLLP